MQIAIPIFDQLTALDCVGPYEVLQRLPGATVAFIGKEKRNVRTDNGFLGLAVDYTFDEISSPDVILVPGGVGTRAFLDGNDHEIITWLKNAHSTSQYTTSVCTGSLVLAAAGLLTDLTATTHWSAYDTLKELGSLPVADRVVEHLDQRIITAAGVSAGIDMALRLSQLLVDTEAAKAMQLMIEYDPQPPFNAGTVSAAGEQVMERLIQYAEHKQ
tara:strand:+ start:1981 stop:2625 length:645 start_codon:yes stop_codon:yes gene_type:complete